MSDRVTEASRRRMAERDHFVSLTPGPYFDIEGPDGLPRLSLRIDGRIESAQLAESLALAIEDWVEQQMPACRVTRRRTA